ncbi:hypothetical protein M8818_002891 [Zalaria obscura]|uniref:Uncharacterized protein n=1 Tax=Zalaria obscura TaxID=2024903 RepID=A0ACC3SH69_9PEZI
MSTDGEDLYPEEIEAAQTEAGLVKLFDDYWDEAVRLREKYKSQINILIGFECEWIRSSSCGLVETALNKHKFDFFMGSIHHVHSVPIDFDHELYWKARAISGGSDEALFEDFFDEQYDMLQALKPLIVGHFDLIRLKSDDPERSFTDMENVWRKINRNLEFIASYGGILELNSSSFRKGMSEPYPKVEICQVSLYSGRPPNRTS